MTIKKEKKSRKQETKSRISFVMRNQALGTYENRISFSSGAKSLAIIFRKTSSKQFAERHSYKRKCYSNSNFALHLKGISYHLNTFERKTIKF